MSDSEEIAQKTVIGLAFGNTSSSIAYTGPDGKAEVIANEEGDRQIPSVLSYVENEEYHGAQAKEHLVRNPKNTVVYFRDFIGKKYAAIDPTNSHSSAHPIDHNDAAAFSLLEKTDAEPNTVSVSEITTRHLTRLRDSAADYLGKHIDGAVITVPTDFTEAQRKALVAAAEACKLNILQVIQEPVACVLAYEAREDTTHPVDKRIVVVDVGGTRTDVTVVASRGGISTILATIHDYELGGLKFDEVLVEHFSKEFMKKHKVDPRSNEKSLAKLRLACESTKRALSLSNAATISIDGLADGYDFHSSINRVRYDLLAKKEIDQVVKLVENVIAKADLDLLDIDEVILAGGTSHTPKLAQRIESIFPETTDVHSPATSTTALNPSELAARGAAIQASLIAEFEKEDVEQSTHPAVTVTPHLSKSIGVVISGADGKEDFHTILEAETAVPARRTAILAGPKDGGDVLVRICEASRQIVVTKPEPKQKPATNGAAGSDDEEDSDEEEEEDEVRSRNFSIETTIAEAALKDVKKGAKIEVMLNIGADLALAVTARVVGAQGGVRGSIEAPSS